MKKLFILALFCFVLGCGQPKIQTVEEDFETKTQEYVILPENPSN